MILLFIIMMNKGEKTELLLFFKHSIRAVVELFVGPYQILSANKLMNFLFIIM